MSRHLSLALALLTGALLFSGCSKTKSECKGGSTDCGGVCVSLRSDNLNCGGCGIACAPGQQCSAGACACPTARPDACGADAGAFCTDTQTDPDNCGGCGTSCATTKGPGFVCASGACVANCFAAQSACPAGSPTYCANLENDANNCGACGNACPAGQQCVNLACQCPPANPDPIYAGTVVAGCTDLRIDPANCGTSGNVCAQNQFCSGGKCADTCFTGQTACFDSYCATVDVDPNNCGTCGGACAGGQACSGGHCACPAATPDSCGSGAAAFCTSRQTDPLNCGACGNACAAGTACTGGQCKTSCPAGEYACSGRCVDPLTDQVYCGANPDCSGGTVCGTNEACYKGACSPTWPAAKPFAGTLGTTSWAQTVPALDGGPYVFPGQANWWNLASDLSLLYGLGSQWEQALVVATGTVDPSWAFTTLFDDFAKGALQVNRLDRRGPQAPSELTFLTPAYATFDGVVVGSVAGAIYDPGNYSFSPLSGTRSALLNGTADSRIARTISLAAGTYSVSFQYDLSPIRTSVLPGAEHAPYGPRFQAVLRDPSTRAIIGDPLFATTAVDYAVAGAASATFTRSGAGEVVLSFELRAGAGGSAAIDDVALSQGGSPVASFTNGGFESGQAPWELQGGPEPRNVRGGVRTLAVDPSGLTTLAVTRTFFAPPAAPWGRMVDVFRNDGAAPITADVVYWINRTVPVTPAAEELAGAGAFVAWDVAGAARDLGVVFGSGQVLFGTESSGTVPRDAFVVHRITVPAHGRAALVHFVVQLGETSPGAAVPGDTAALCREIAAGFRSNPEYASWLEAGQLFAIQNL